MNNLLLLAGILLLVATLGFSAVRVRHGQLRAGWISVLLTLIACVLVTAGSIRIAFAAPARSDVTAVATSVSNTIPSETSALPDTTPRDPTLQNLRARYLPLLLTAGVSLLIILAGFALYRVERRQDEFEPSHSPGLLTIGAGIYMVVASLVIPIIPLELAGVRLGAALTPTSTGPAPTRRVSLTSTPTNTPRPSETPTLLPSLTPTVSETPIVLYTPIAYSSTYAVNTPTPCTGTAKTMLNLRGDPSVEQQAIGRIFAGSLLYVTGRTADKKWLQIVSSDGSITLKGWVSADYVTVDAACNGQTVSIIGPTDAPTQTGTPSQNVTPSPTSVGTQAGTAAPCTLLTTTSASLRADPSRVHEALAQIPERTALTATGKTVDGQWWRVIYGDKAGWIGAGVVLTSASCSAIPAVTLTPVP